MSLQGVKTSQQASDLLERLDLRVSDLVPGKYEGATTLSQRRETLRLAQMHRHRQRYSELLRQERPQVGDSTKDGCMQIAMGSKL
jgi:hypothetical protein